MFSNPWVSNISSIDIISSIQEHIYMHSQKCIRQLYLNIQFYHVWVQLCHLLGMSATLNVYLSNAPLHWFSKWSLYKSCISPSINWKYGQCLDTFSTHLPLYFRLFGCLPFWPEHYTRNIIQWCELVLAKRLNSKLYLKVGISLGICVVCNLSLSIPCHIQPCSRLIHD